MQNVLECSAWNAWLFSIEQWNYKRRVRKTFIKKEKNLTISCIYK